jgi:hypothetical protein
MTQIQLVVKEPGAPPRTTTAGNDLRSLQQLVGGLIEVVEVGGGVVLVVNEEGKLEGLPPNLYCPRVGDWLLGPVLAVARDPDDEGDFQGFSDAEAQQVLDRFRAEPLPAFE